MYFSYPTILRSAGLSLLLLLGGTSNIAAQRNAKLTKYQVAAIIEFGSAFPNYEPANQLRWQPGVYAAGAITLEGIQRLNLHWQLIAGLGLSPYLLNNNGPDDNYSLDFISPHFRLGAGYLSSKKQRGHHYLMQLMMGAQLGYTKTLVEEFETYQVEITGGKPFYYFTRAEWGVRWPWQKRYQRGLPKPFNEVGIFYRYNFNGLGTARFTGSDYILDMKPSGNILGGYFRVVLPAGRKKVKLPDPLPPAAIIYHPRMSGPN
ncbi:MAG: hypothetical protein AAGJ93_05445 [Bacteroidota bacterium]